MKTTKTNAALAHSVQRLQGDITHEHKMILKEVPIWACQFGRADHSLSNEKSAEGYYMQLRSRYSKLYYSVQLSLHRAGTTGTQEVTAMEERLAGLQVEMDDGIKERRHLKDEQQKVPLEHEHAGHHQYLLLLFGLGIFDCLSMIAAFLGVFKDLLIIAVAMGAMVGIGLFLLIKTATLAFRDSQEERAKQIVKWIILPMVIFAGVIFGILRYRQTVDDGSHVLLSPLVFIMINLITIACSIFVVYNHFPTNEQVQYYAAWQKLENKIQNTNDKIQKLTNEIKTVQSAKLAIEMHEEQVRHSLQTFRGMIQSLYEEAVGIFITQVQKDGLPVPFHNPLPLPFQIGDPNIHPLNNQQ